eukprot:scaffold7532_cov102-Isochrysis_galbana.AAC.2
MRQPRTRDARRHPATAAPVRNRAAAHRLARRCAADRHNQSAREALQAAARRPWRRKAARPATRARHAASAKNSRCRVAARRSLRRREPRAALSISDPNPLWLSAAAAAVIAVTATWRARRRTAAAACHARQEEERAEQQVSSRGVLGRGCLQDRVPSPEGTELPLRAPSPESTESRAHHMLGLPHRKRNEARAAASRRHRPTARRSKPRFDRVRAAARRRPRAPESHRPTHARSGTRPSAICRRKGCRRPRQRPKPFCIWREARHSMAVLVRRSLLERRARRAAAPRCLPALRNRRSARRSAKAVEPGQGTLGASAAMIRREGRRTRRCRAAHARHARTGPARNRRLINRRLSRWGVRVGPAAADGWVGHEAWPLHAPPAPTHRGLSLQSPPTHRAPSPQSPPSHRAPSPHHPPHTGPRLRSHPSTAPAPPRTRRAAVPPATGTRLAADRRCGGRRPGLRRNDSAAASSWAAYAHHATHACSRHCCRCHAAAVRTCRPPSTNSGRLRRAETQRAVAYRRTDCSRRRAAAPRMAAWRSRQAVACCQRLSSCCPRRTTSCCRTRSSRASASRRSLADDEACARNNRGPRRRTQPKGRAGKGAVGSGWAGAPATRSGLAWNALSEPQPASKGALGRVRRGACPARPRPAAVVGRFGQPTQGPAMAVWHCSRALARTQCLPEGDRSQCLVGPGRTVGPRRGPAPK